MSHFCFLHSKCYGKPSLARRDLQVELRKAEEISTWGLDGMTIGHTLLKGKSELTGKPSGQFGAGDR